MRTGRLVDGAVPRCPAAAVTESVVGEPALMVREAGCAVIETRSQTGTAAVVLLTFLLLTLTQ